MFIKLKINKHKKQELILNKNDVIKFFINPTKYKFHRKR